MRSFVHRLALFSLAVLPAAGWADCDPNVQAQLERLLTRAVDDPQVYQSKACGGLGVCHANAHALARKFAAEVPGFNLDEARVLVFVPKDGKILRSFGSKRLAYKWRYHVVVEYKGKIFDLDLHAGAKAVEARQYLETMFLHTDLTTETMLRSLGLMFSTRDDLLLNLRVKAIPARWYVDHVDPKIHERVDRFWETLGPPGAPYADEDPLRLFGVQQKDLRYPAEAAWLSEEVDRKIMASGTLRIDEEVEYVRWAYEGVQYKLDLRQGLIHMLDVQSRQEIHDPIRARYFIRRLYLERHSNDELVDALAETAKQRLGL